MAAVYRVWSGRAARRMPGAVTTSPTHQSEPMPSALTTSYGSSAGATGYDHASTGSGCIPPRLQPTALLDQLVARVRPQAEHLAAQVLGQADDLDPGQSANGSFGVVTQRPTTRFTHHLLGRTDQQLMGLPLHDIQDGLHLVAAGEIARQRGK